MDEHDYAAVKDCSSNSSSRKSLGRQCVAFGCHNYQYKMENGERVPTNISMFQFPQDKSLKDEWCRLIKRVDGRDSFKVSDSTRVCSSHFQPSDFKGKRLNRPIAKPVLHSWNSFAIKQPRRPLVRAVDVSVSDASNEKNPLVEVEPFVVEEDSINDDDIDFMTNTTDVELIDVDTVIYEDIHTTNCDEMTVGDYKNEIVHLKARIVELETEIDCLKKEKATTTTVKDKFKSRIMSNDDECTHATGFHSVGRLNEFYKFLDPGENGEKVLMTRSKDKVCMRRPRILSPFEGFLLMLCRLKSGFSIKHLCFLFGASVGAVDSHFMMWLAFVYFKVASISWWPSKQTIIETMPSSMKEKFPSVRVIIDCSEFPAENPSSLSMQKLFYSSYKSRVTVKVLLGIMPGGGFTFVSSAYPGSTSDREIVIKSGLLNPMLYEEGDSIMADRGFTIQDLVEPMGVRLIIPSFLSGRQQLSKEETVLTQQIAAERIHVERAIQRLKSYNVLNCIPVALYDSINEIITVCACLSNMQNPIISN